MVKVNMKDEWRKEGKTESEKKVLKKQTETKKIALRDISIAVRDTQKTIICFTNTLRQLMIAAEKSITFIRTKNYEIIS